jgi:hypothetical protein
MRVLIQTFTAPGTYQPSPGLVSLVVECIGGGGGGGQCGTPSGDANVIVTGAGGGSGGYSRKALAGSLVLGGVAVTVAGSAAAQLTGTPTSFGAFCVANGGGGGQGNSGTSPDYGQAGIEANPGIGDVAFPGACGENGTLDVVAASPLAAISAQGGRGGCIFGGTSSVVVAPANAANGVPGASNTGAGGSGAAINQLGTLTVYNGGAGGSGLCIVTEYCWADTTGGSSGCVNVPACPPGQWGYDG